MRVAVIGSRKSQRYSDEEPIWLVADAMARSGLKPTLILTAAQRKLERSAITWASSLDPSIPVKVMARDNLLGAAEALVAIWDGRSLETARTINQAMAMGLRVSVYWIKPV